MTESGEDAVHHDLSNMGKCDVCGRPIDLRDAGHEIVLMTQEEPDHEGVTAEDATEAMIRALRRCGKPEDHAVADAYEEQGGFKAHRECYEKTSIPGFPTED